MLTLEEEDTCMYYVLTLLHTGTIVLTLECSQPRTRAFGFRVYGLGFRLPVRGLGDVL